jgi:hypothetical protein
VAKLYSDIYEKLRVDNPGVEIVAIYKTGSSLFLEDPKDKDYVVIAENIIYDHKPFVNIKGTETNRTDLFVYSRKYFESIINFQESPRQFFHAIAWLSGLIVKPEDIIYGSIPKAKTNIIENESYVRGELGRLVHTTGLLRPDRYEISSSGYLPKRLYWAYIIIRFLDKKNFVIDEEMTEFIKNVRDKRSDKMEEYRKIISDGLMMN